jgi:xanthosine phosphorylase
MTESIPHVAANYIQAQAQKFIPHTAIILGSGLAEAVEYISPVAQINYQDLPGFPSEEIEGQRGQLVLGYWGKHPIVCLQGRAHIYQGWDSLHNLTNMVRTISCLGCHDVIITNAAGGIDDRLNTGDLAIVKDHINFQGFNPLIGANDENFGPRFFGMEDAYCPEMRKHFIQCAQQLALTLPESVYVSTLGPMFETPAEINMFRMLGAELVGMSTVPEVILARHAGLKVAALSMITNKAAGMENQTLSHELTLEGAKSGYHKLMQLLQCYFSLSSST